MTVLHRVPVDVINMTRQVFPVADAMFPIARLPDAAFALSTCSFRLVRQAPRKARLELRDPARKIMIVVGQSPHEMEMFRQDDGRNGFKGSRGRYGSP